MQDCNSLGHTNCNVSCSGLNSVCRNIFSRCNCLLALVYLWTRREHKHESKQKRKNMANRNYYRLPHKDLVAFVIL